MRNSNICKQCECYNCDLNDRCLERQSCIDNEYFVDKSKSTCRDRKEVEDDNLNGYFQFPQDEDVEV